MRTTHSPAVWRTTLVTALTPVIWGTTYALSSEILPQGLPLSTAAIRTLPAGILLVLVTGHFRPVVPWGRLLVLSFLNISAFQALLFVAAQRLPGGIAAVVGALQPLMLVFLSWAMDHRRPYPPALAAALLGIAGMAGLFMPRGSSLDAMGIGAAFLGSACMAIGTHLTVRWRNDMPLLPFIGWKLALGGLVLSIPALLFEPALPPLSVVQGLGFAYLSLLGTVVAYMLWFRGLALLPPVAVSALGLLSPVTAMAIGWLLLDEKLQPIQMAGIAVVLASVGLLQSSPKTGPRPPGRGDAVRNIRQPAARP
jgi:probable blue pigment (indigoidine) exporter